MKPGTYTEWAFFDPEDGVVTPVGEPNAENTARHLMSRVTGAKLLHRRVEIVTTEWAEGSEIGDLS